MAAAANPSFARNIYGRINKSARKEAAVAAKFNQIAINVKKDPYYDKLIAAIAQVEIDLKELRNKKNPTANNDKKLYNLDVLLIRLLDLKEAYEVEHIFEHTEKVYANLEGKVGNTRRNTGILAHTLEAAARNGLNNKRNNTKRRPTALAPPDRTSTIYPPLSPSASSGYPPLGPSISASNYRPLGPTTSASNYRPLGPSTSASNYKVNNRRNKHYFLQPSASGTVTGLPKMHMPARAGAGGPQKNWWL